MELRITPIGVHEAFTREGFQTGYLLEAGADCLLVDCGTTAAPALESLGRSLQDIDRVYISHLHLDHVGGLPELALCRYLSQKPRPKIYLHNSLERTIWENFLSGLLSRYVDTAGVAKTATAETFFEIEGVSEAKEEDDEPLVIGDLLLRLVEVEHIQGAPSFGLVVNDSVFITSDTRFLPQLLDELANRFGLQAIFHDCSFRPGLDALHTTYQQLLELPEDIRELLILTHYESDYQSLLKKGQKLELELAEAGKTYTF